MTNMAKMIVGVLVAVVILGGGYFVLRDTNVENQTANVEGALQNENANVEGEKKMAFLDFVKQGGSYMCEVHQDVKGVDNVGTVYLADGKVSGIFHTNAGDTPVDAMFIIRDGMTYMWSSAMPKVGFKSKVDLSAVSADASTAPSYTWNAGAVRDYNCTPWTADEAKFTVPTTITFTEISAQQ